MNSVIHYHPEAYTTSGPKLMGRNAAGESFLRGYLSYSQATTFWAQVQKPEHGQHFAAQVKAQGRTESVHALRPHNLSALSQVGLVYYPDPDIGRHAFHRSVAVGSHAAWSLCGITHTTSSAGAMDAISELITAPVQPWDAVICTSTAVKDNVSKILQAQVNMLKERLGIGKLVLPMLPVIPLGIHTQDFVFTPAQKNAARLKLNANDNTLVVLFMGRLSFHAKAHPLAMYQALQTAAQALQASGKKIKLVECGWHANKFIQKAYQDAAHQVCPDVEVITLDGRKAEDRETAWAGADVFCALSDNIQETFGIVPIEAMAAGLPVVVSDWDGYKDTVRHDVDGFRISTTMPEAGLATDLALRHALEIDTYDMYCGHTCSLVSVDIDQAANAFVKLFESSSLRQSMGASGRQRAQQVYDWKVIIAQYEALWAEQQSVRLAALKSTSSPPVKLAHPWPARMDPFYALASYPTQTLTANTVLCLADVNLEAATARLQTYQALAMVSFAKWVLPNDAEIAAVLKQASHGPQAALDLVMQIEEKRRPFVFRTLAWFLKLGVLKVPS
jgi:glycosyltransferase involved in cell wall biosynthesis